MAITIIIFDLFGTLIHLEDDTKPYLELFSELGLNEQQMQDARRIVMTKNFTSLDKFVDAIAPCASIDLRPYKESIRQEISSARLDLTTLPVLHRLREEGYRVGMISNLATPYKQAFFDLGLQHHIDRYVFSCDEGCKKPEPEIYGLLLRQMNTDASEAIMIGDNIKADVLGPRGVGMNALLLDRSGKEPGCIPSLESVFDYL